MNTNKLTVLFLFSLTAMAGNTSVREPVSPLRRLEQPDFNGRTLTIYNSSDYISEGEGEEDLIGRFEELYGCTVNYYTFDTVETMYNQFTLQKEGTYDLLCPSEYMIQRLVNEDLIVPLDKSKLGTYYQYGSRNVISKLEQMKTSSLDANGEYLTLADYAAGYMWGTMGLVYDPEYVDEEDVKSWDILWDNNYKNMASVKNSMRDTYVVGILHAYEDELSEARRDYLEGKLSADNYNKKIQTIFDLHDQENVDKVKNELISMKSNIYGFEVDSGKNDIITGKIKMNLAWSGDAVYSIDTAAEEADKTLRYSVPEEGSNIWYDGWVLPKGADEDLAYAFINFLSDPYNAAINMNYIGYTSFIASEEVFDQVASWYGAPEFYEGTEYFSEDETVVHYQDDFYLCVKDSIGHLPTDKTYFEKLEEETPLPEPYDMSYYFGDTLPKGKEAVIYPYEEYANELETQYPGTEILLRCAFMNDFGEDNANVIIMWGQVKAATNMVPYYVIMILAVAFVPCFFLVRYIRDRNVRKYASMRNEPQN